MVLHFNPRLVRIRMAIISLPCILLAPIVSPARAQSQNSATCVQFFNTISHGKEDVALQYVLPVWQRLDEAAVARGCEPLLPFYRGNGRYEELLDLVKTMCRGTSGGAIEPLLYDQVLQSYSMARSTANFMGGTGYGNGVRPNCQ